MLFHFLSRVITAMLISNTDIGFQSVRSFVCPSVCHALVLYWNGL